MTLNLTRRLVKGTPLTAAEHDGNLDKLEDGIEARELLGAVAAHVAAADPHSQYLTQAEGDARYRQSATPLSDADIPSGIARDSEVASAISAHESAADPHSQYLTAAEGDAAYATAAQGALAATAVQPGGLATVATSGAYNDLSGRPTLGTAAATASTDYAPAAQGVTNGNSHDHNGGDGAQIAYSSLSGLPTIPAPADAAPQALGATAAIGSSTDYAREDHVHQRDSDVIVVPVGDEASALSAGTNRVRFRMPFAATLLAVRASVNTAPTGSTLVVDVNEGGTSVLGTKLSIDATELTSATADSAATITDSALADDAEISIDIDQIGSTIAGAGLKVSLFVRRT
jgi:hypothetical protein